jgi:23S rRNA (adenine2503-C2)-methyltransferase
MTLQVSNLSVPLIYEFNLNDLNNLYNFWGEPSYRALQTWKGLYQDYCSNADAITTLPNKLRERLSKSYSFNPFTTVNSLVSQDGKTKKLLFRMLDGNEIETVLMIYSHRQTLCISTQSGCAMGCQFCATGQMGFKRNLSSGEIIAQVLVFTRLLGKNHEKLTNIVIMGMGEPFHNYKATMDALDRLNDPDGYNFGERRFTISTVGIIPKIKKFTRERRQVNLAVSLHAADDDLRTQLLPINKKYPLDDLLDSCREYVATTHRRISFEWALIKDINDSPLQALKLASKLKGFQCHVNVIPLNPTLKYHGVSASYQQAREFKDILETKGISCTIRLRRGIDIQAGCGQLANHYPINTMPESMGSLEYENE